MVTKVNMKRLLLTICCLGFIGSIAAQVSETDLLGAWSIDEATEDGAPDLNAPSYLLFSKRDHKLYLFDERDGEIRIDETVSYRVMNDSLFVIQGRNQDRIHLPVLEISDEVLVFTIPEQRIVAWCSRASIEGLLQAVVEEERNNYDEEDGADEETTTEEHTIEEPDRDD